MEMTPYWRADAESGKQRVLASASKERLLNGCGKQKTLA